MDSDKVLNPTLPPKIKIKIRYMSTINRYTYFAFYPYGFVVR